MLTHYEHKHAKGTDLSGHSGKLFQRLSIVSLQKYEKCQKYQFLQNSKNVACTNAITIILKSRFKKLDLFCYLLGQ